MVKKKVVKKKTVAHHRRISKAKISLQRAKKKIVPRKKIEKFPHKKIIKKVIGHHGRTSRAKISLQGVKKPEKKKVLKKKIRKILRKPLKKLGRAKTGIRIFDKMIKGGFERESINLIVGGSGSGKSIFALQFLLEGLKKGEKGLYVTFEEKKEDFYKNMKKFGWDLEKEEKAGRFIFLEYSPEKVKMMLDEGGGSIETIVLKHSIKRLVVDSITSFSLLFDDKLSKRQSTLALFEIISKWNCTTLFTVQHDPLYKSDEEIASIEFEADSLIRLHFINIKNKRERFIEVLKMRGTNHSTEIRSFNIKKGIKIGKRARIKSEFLK